MKIYVLAYRRETARKAARKYEEEGFRVFRIFGLESPDTRARYAKLFKDTNDAGKKIAYVATMDAMIAAIDVGEVDEISIIERHPNEEAQKVAAGRARRRGRPMVS